MYHTKPFEAHPKPEWFAIRRLTRHLVQDSSQALLPLHQKELTALRHQIKSMRPQPDLDLLEHLANHDALTKLPNRRLLYEHLDQTLIDSSRSGYYGALLFMDIDHFKSINDQYGHEAGDKLLIEISKRIKTALNTNDLVARFGGDEFVVLIQQLQPTYTQSVTDIESYALRISKAVEGSYEFESRTHHQHSHRCTASIGVALFTNHSNTRDEILKKADTAMYQAKRHGRNEVCLWEEPTQ